MVCSPKSCSQINRSFSSITLLAFHGMRAPCLQRQPLAHSVRNPPGLFCQPCARSVPQKACPPHPPGNSYGFQNKGVARFDCCKLLKTIEPERVWLTAHLTLAERSLAPLGMNYPRWIVQFDCWKLLETKRQQRALASGLKWTLKGPAVLPPPPLEGKECVNS